MRRASQQLALFAEDHVEERSPSRKPWAWLLKHVFAVDVTVCPQCKGPMRWIEVATTPDAIARLVAAEAKRLR